MWVAAFSTDGHVSVSSLYRSPFMDEKAAWGRVDMVGGSSEHRRMVDRRNVGRWVIYVWFSV